MRPTISRFQVDHSMLIGTYMLLAACGRDSPDPVFDAALSGDGAIVDVHDAGSEAGTGGRPDASTIDASVGSVGEEDGETVGGGEPRPDPDADAGTGEACPADPETAAGEPCNFSSPVCQYGGCLLDWRSELKCVNGRWEYTFLSCTG